MVVRSSTGRRGGGRIRRFPSCFVPSVCFEGEAGVTTIHTTPPVAGWSRTRTAFSRAWLEVVHVRFYAFLARYGPSGDGWDVLLALRRRAAYRWFVRGVVYCRALMIRCA